GMKYLFISDFGHSFSRQFAALYDMERRQRIAFDCPLHWHINCIISVDSIFFFLVPSSWRFTHTWTHGIDTLLCLLFNFLVRMLPLHINVLHLYINVTLKYIVSSLR